MCGSAVSECVQNVRKAAVGCAPAATERDAGWVQRLRASRGVNMRWRAVACKSYLGEVELVEGAALVVPAFISFHTRH